MCVCRFYIILWWQPRQPSVSMNDFYYSKWNVKWGFVLQTEGWCNLCRERQTVDRNVKKERKRLLRWLQVELHVHYLQTQKESGSVELCFACVCVVLRCFFFFMLCILMNNNDLFDLWCVCCVALCCVWVGGLHSVQACMDTLQKFNESLQVNNLRLELLHHLLLHLGWVHDLIAQTNFDSNQDEQTSKSQPSPIQLTNHLQLSYKPAFLLSKNIINNKTLYNPEKGPSSSILTERNNPG